MQLRILGPIIYGVVAGRLVEVERIDPALATAYLELVGHRSECALLIAHGGLDAAAARRLGTAYGLLTTPYGGAACQEEVSAVDEVGLTI